MANDHGIENSAAADKSRRMIQTAAAPVVREAHVFIRDTAKDTIHGNSGIMGQAARMIINRDLIKTDSGLGIRKEDGAVKPLHVAGYKPENRSDFTKAAGRDTEKQVYIDRTRGRENAGGRNDRKSAENTPKTSAGASMTASRKTVGKKQAANRYSKKITESKKRTQTAGNYGIAKAAGKSSGNKSSFGLHVGRIMQSKEQRRKQRDREQKQRNKEEILEGALSEDYKKVGIAVAKEKIRRTKKVVNVTTGAPKKLMKETIKAKRIAEVMGSGDAQEMTERVSMMGFNTFVRTSTAIIRHIVRQTLSLLRLFFTTLFAFSPGVAFILIAVLVLMLCSVGTQSAQQVIRSRQNAYSSMAVGRVSGARIASLGTGCDWNTYHTNSCYNASGPNPYQGQYGLDAYSGARGHNCTAYAWGRFYEITGEGLASCTGDALSWYSAAVNEGIWATGQTPMVGAVVVWDYGTGHGGHVAVIEEIKEDGTITTSNSGYSSSCRASHTGTNRSPEGHRCIWYNETFAGEAAIERAHGIFCGYIYPWHIGEEPRYGNTGTVTSNFTDEDVRYLAACIFLEGGSGYDYEGMLAVGTVVMNRIDSSSFPDTIQGVITQPYQFEVTTLPRWSSTLADPPEPAIACAQDILNGTRSTRISSSCIAFRAASMGTAWLSSYHYNRSANVNGNLFGWQE